MAPRLPQHVVDAIEVAINIAHTAGKRPDMENIALIFNTTYESITRIRRRLRDFERTGVDNRKKSGRKRLQGLGEDEIAQFVGELIQTRPDLDQKGISEVLMERFQLKIGQSTISRLMKDKGIPHKRTNRLYRKTKLVSTNPEGKVWAPRENESALEIGDGDGDGDGRELAASALSELNMMGNGVSYRSPYAESTPTQIGMGMEGLPITPSAQMIYGNSPYL